MCRLVCVALFTLVVACSPTAAQPAPPPLNLGRDLTHRHFLFVRHDRAEDGTQTDTLVMATIERDGFELHDVYSEDNLDIGSDLIGVAGGKAYLMHIGDLLCIDLYGGACTRIAADAEPYAYASGRLFCLQSGEVCDYDLRSERWRMVTAVPGRLPPDRLAVSPDCRWLVFFTDLALRDLPSGWQLNVLDLEQGTTQRLGELVQYLAPAASSFRSPPPPCAWLDETHLLFVRTDTEVRRAAQDRVELAGDPVNWIAVAEVTTGQVRDVAPIPGSFHRTTMIEFRHLHPALPPMLEIGFEAPTAGRYLVDVDGSKLVETDSIGGDFRLLEQDDLHSLYHGHAPLAESRATIHAAVSPDQKAVIWTEGHGDAKLQFYHEDDGFVRTVTEGFFGECLLWFGDEALSPADREPPLQAEWREFERTVHPEPQEPDTREDIADHLSFTIACDKESYKLHEPVLLTLSVTNKSTLDFEVARPRIDWRIMQLGMDYPGGGKSVDGFWGSSEIHPIEKVALKPGQSISTTETIETAQPKRYTIHAEYHTHNIAAQGDREFRGGLRAEPVEFTVEATAGAQELLAAKVDRLLAALHDQQAKAPEWDGWLPPVDDIVDLGEPGVPYVLEALDREDNVLIVQRLFWALKEIGSSDALPAYVDALTHEDAEVRELGVLGLYELARRDTPIQPEALGALLGVLAGHFPDDLRAVAARNLANLRDPAIKAAFEESIGREDAAVAESAGRYLAAWEEMDLADWLAEVAEQPTQARFAAARVIIADLRGTWHSEAMPDLGGVTWEEVSENAGRLAAFREVVQAWQKWAEEHSRLSKTYFDVDREDWGD